MMLSHKEDTSLSQRHPKQQQVGVVGGNSGIEDFLITQSSSPPLEVLPRFFGEVISLLRKRAVTSELGLRAIVRFILWTSYNICSGSLCLSSPPRPQQCYGLLFIFPVIQTAKYQIGLKFMAKAIFHRFIGAYDTIDFPLFSGRFFAIPCPLQHCSSLGEGLKSVIRLIPFHPILSYPV